MQKNILNFKSDLLFYFFLGWDLGVMGGENLKQSLLSTGLDLVQGSLEANELEKSGEIVEEHLLDNLLEPPLNTTFWENELPVAIDYHDQLLVCKLYLLGFVF